MKLRVLVVDDEAAIRDELEEALVDAGYEVRTAPDGAAAAALAQGDSFDLCLTDVRMPAMGGIELLARLCEASPETAVLLMTAYAELDTAVAALRLGAVDYLMKPFRHDELLAKLGRIAAHRRLVLENRNLRRAVEDARPPGAARMLGGSAAMRRLLETIDRVASLPTRVLITGESGTGKELVARALHERGERAAAPFVPINCAAIPEPLLESELFGHVKGAFTGALEAKEGLLRTAGDGTLFLDELGELPLALQAKLLRALESHEIQPVGATRRIPIRARVVAATNRDLRAECAAGRFREDLWYRLAVVEIEVPPLRERREDVPLLAAHFVERFARELERPVKRVGREALALLCGHEWRGNVRELSNAIERAVIFAAGEEIGPEDLPAALRGAVPLESAARDGAPARLEDAARDGAPARLEDATREFERAMIRRAIEQCGGNKRLAARQLGIGPTSLYRKLGEPPDDITTGPDPAPARG